MIHPKSRVAIAGTTVFIQLLNLYSTPFFFCFLLSAHADIWRYAALYAFGGFYIDDDADFNESFERVWTQYLFKNLFAF